MTVNQWQISRSVRVLALHRPAGRTAHVLLWSISLAGFLIAADFLLERGLVERGGDGGVDVLAYWHAGRHAFDGRQLYANDGVGGAAAYLYPPLLAQLLALPAFAPFAVFAWGWRALELACLRLVVGSWRATGIALLVFPLLIAELDAGNVHLIVAAALALLLRGSARAVLPLAVVTKFAPLAAVPLAAQRDRRALAQSALFIAIVCAGSVIADPGAWHDWLRQITHAGEAGSARLGALPSVPLALRLVIGGALGFAAVRWHRLVVPAVVLCYPVVWWTSLSTLVALVEPSDWHGSAADRPTRSS
jgi:hypothetical protein